MSKTPSVPGTDRPAEKAAGHWLLAQLGKKVLRPGGRPRWPRDHQLAAGSCSGRRH